MQMIYAAQCETIYLTVPNIALNVQVSVRLQ